MNIRYTAAALAFGVAISAAMGAATAAPASASPAHPATAAAHAPLSQPLRARLAPSTAALPANTIQIVSWANTALCLDANDAGSTAGKNGDKVQLWGCNGGTQQDWTLYKENGSTGNFTLYNDKYPHECLNADDSGGLADGRKVQLWACGTTSNFYWSVGSWSSCLSVEATCVFLLEADNYAFQLNARSPGIGNGDVVQIWRPIQGALNEDWVCKGDANVCVTFSCPICSRPSQTAAGLSATRVDAYRARSERRLILVP